MKLRNVHQKEGVRTHNTLIAYRLCEHEGCCCESMVNSLCKSISINFIHECCSNSDHAPPEEAKMDTINAFINKYFFKKYTSVIFIECRCTDEIVIIDLDLIDSNNNYIVFNERIIRKKEQAATRSDLVESFTDFLRSSLRIPQAYLSDGTISSIKMSHL